MRAYSRADEESVRDQARVRAWTAAGLLSPEQGTALEAELRTDLRRTHVVLRGVLAFFTALIVAAAVGLFFTGLSIESRAIVAVVLWFFGFVSLGIADGLVTQMRFYRHGIEEALAVCGIALLTFGTMLLFDDVGSHVDGQAGLAVAVLGGIYLYARFGFVYAIVAALPCAAALAFQFGLPDSIARASAALVLLGAIGATRALRPRDAGDYRIGDYAVFQAAAWVFVYLLLNLRVGDVWRDLGLYSSFEGERGFYWITYVAVCLMPIAGLTVSIRERDRPLLIANLALALLTLATNKPYLGWPRQPWDPIILGVLLVTIALGVRRWLARGPNGTRGGFTAEKLDANLDAIRYLGTVSVLVKTPTAAPSDHWKGFQGGRSGGGGASGDF